jgi:hypothetical protein
LFEIKSWLLRVFWVLLSGFDVLSLTEMLTLWGIPEVGRETSSSPVTRCGWPGGEVA